MPSPKGVVPYTPSFWGPNTGSAHAPVPNPCATALAPRQETVLTRQNDPVAARPPEAGAQGSESAGDSCLPAACHRADELRITQQHGVRGCDGEVAVDLSASWARDLAGWLTAAATDLSRSSRPGSEATAKARRQTSGARASGPVTVKITRHAGVLLRL